MNSELKSTLGSILSNGFLIILTGLPSSGKSTFANELKIQFKKINSNYQIEIIDTDEIRIQKFGDLFHPEHESSVRLSVIEKVEENLRLNSIVISDDINYFESMRHELVTTSKELFKPYFIIYIATSLKICIKWNQERKSPLSEDIIYQISEKFDIPGLKYKWDKPFRSFDLSSDNLIISCSQLVNDITNFMEITHFKKKIFTNVNGKVTTKGKIEDITKKILSIYSIFYQKNQTNIDLIDNSQYYKGTWSKKERELILYSFETNFNLLKSKFGNSIGEMNKKRKYFVKNYSGNNLSLKKLIYDFLEFLLNS